jgi:hypothetical protein
VKQLKIFCTSIDYYKIIDNLPNYIEPLGLGKKYFPSNWIDEKKGENISNLNSFYGELTGIYWLWKNRIPEMKKNDIIGICHYRKLWLKKNYLNKQKFSTSSLYSNLLDYDNFSENYDCIQVQPIIFKNKNLLDDFKEIHKVDILEDCANFLDEKEKILFLKHLNDNILYPLNMFITRVELFEKYCEKIFPWLEKCLEFCIKKNLCENYNMRLPAFLAERFTSFWFAQLERKRTLSYARLGNFFLSNNVNRFINPIKLPLTFRMYPTIHRY